MNDSRKPTTEELRQYARALGCTCDVEIVLEELPIAPGAYHVHYSHSSTCPYLLRAAALTN